ncbi:MAG: hypothetical protein L0J18_13575 [Tetragenococcus koreensis]|nr:hypothetical protein [Tetragenococcus koreensis]
MEIKQVLDNLKRAEDEIETYRGMQQHTIELYQSAGYTSDTLKRMIDYTNNRIQEEQVHHDYWHDLITKIDDDRYRKILTLRYIKNKTVEEVASELFYSVRYTAQLINQAIKALERIHSKAYKG